MTKNEYRQLRRLIRDNGNYALKWMHPTAAAIMNTLARGQKVDKLAERADSNEYFKRCAALRSLR